MRTIIRKDNQFRLFGNIIICISAVVLLTVRDNPIHAQEKADSRFEQILSSVENSIGTEKEMVLKLRDIDYINEKIIFYDEDNIDIIFDITDYKKDKHIRKSLRNAHEGVRYRVRFIIKGVDPNGLLSGKLIEFYPVFMDVLQ